VEEAAAAAEPIMELLPLDDRAPGDAFEELDIAPPPAPPAPTTQARERDTVLCYVCGDIMQRAGSCHACQSCGATSGCS
jgi:ribonucleoside-diphosphate reductase alpha chain